EHIQRVLEMPKVTAHLLTLPPISVEGHDVKSLTQEVQEKMVEGLAQLHKKVLKPKS
ncbi:putative acyltransferase domain protein, partial [Acinetobacter baumannii 754286]